MEEKHVVRFTIDLDKDLHTNLKILCVGLKKSMKEVVQESLKEKLELMQRNLYEKTNV